MSIVNICPALKGFKDLEKTQIIEISKAAIEDIDLKLKALGLGSSLLIVADQNTYEALGMVLKTRLSGAFSVKVLELEKGVKPSVLNAEMVVNESCACDFLVAVGTGTINDMVKYASSLSGKPYVSVPTAPSVNGFSSSNASLFDKDGVKKTFAATLPVAIYFDTKNAAKAPLRLIRAGFGDMLARTTAQADWLLSHKIFGTKYLELPFEILKESEEQLFLDYMGLVGGDIEVIGLLCKNLILSGFGMVMANGSYPASQAEHMLAHCLEMRYPKIMGRHFHGEQIAVTLLTISRLQHELFKRMPELLEDKLEFEQIHEVFGAKYDDYVQKEYGQKKISKERVAEINHNLVANWQEINDFMSKIMIPTEILVKVIRNIDLSAKAEDLGLKSHEYSQVLAITSYFRSRFTCLDLARISKKS